MGGYAKLFGRILDSTVWREPDHVRLLWITMLAMADRYGTVHCAIPGLADRARITLEQCEQGLTVLESPDKYSGSKEAEGRRIRPIDGGWELINHTKYNRLLSAEDRREKARVRQQRHRENKDVTLSVTQSNACHALSRLSRHTDVDVTPDADADVVSQIPPPFRRKRDKQILKKVAEPYLAEVYKEYPRKVAKAAAYKAITKALLGLLHGHDAPKELFGSMDDAVVYLKARTALFARSPDGQAGDMTPYPATWFNRKSYLDDETEWWRRGEQPTKNQKRIIDNGETILEALFGEEAATGGDGNGEGTNNPRGKAMGASATGLLGS